MGRILSWNAQTLRGKRNLVAHLLGEQQIDVALISETHLRASDSLTIPGYHVYRRDELSPTGTPYRGLAVFVRRRLVHQVLPQEPYNTVYSLGVEVRLNLITLRLYAVYRPPSQPLAPSDVRTLLSVPIPTLIAGDLNAKHPIWHSATTNAAGRALYGDAVQCDYDVAGPDEPTHHDGCGADVLDIIAFNNLLRGPLTQEVLPDLPSDHRPVLITIPTLPIQPTLPRSTTKVDWDFFLETWRNRPPRIFRASSGEEVDGAAEAFTSDILDTLRESSRTVARRERKNPLPTGIRTLIDEKRRLRRHWQSTRCPRLKTKLNTLVEKVKEQLTLFRTESWQVHLDDVGDSVPSLHRLCRQLGSEPDPRRPLRTSDGGQAWTDEERAEVFADMLELQFQPNPLVDSDHADHVEERLREHLEAPLGVGEDPIFFSPKEVASTLRKVNPRKATGLDGIPNAALRRLPGRAAASLCSIFNGIMRTGHFPTPWKCGRVILIPKPGKDRTLPGSYRPITILSNLSKVFERLLLSKMSPHFHPRPEQFGFREGHSTTLQLTRVLHELSLRRNRREYSALALLDVEKAFDRVWHEGLIHKIARSDIPRRITKVISSFLTDRSFIVSIGEARATKRPIRAGVPQGSCLSPALYLLYADDIPIPDGVKLGLFADDIALLASSMNKTHAASKVQASFGPLSTWLDKWRIKINPVKTQAMVTGLGSLPPPLKLYGCSIEWQHTIKYLGVTVDRGLKLRSHAEETLRRTKYACMRLRPILASRLPARTKLGIYKAYARSRLTYAAPSWYVLTAKTVKQRLQTLENRMLRTIAGAPRFVRNNVIKRDFHWSDLDVFVAGLAKNMFSRADQSRHAHLRGIAPLHARPPDGRPYARELLPASADEIE